MNNDIKNKQNRKVTIFALFLSLVSVGILVFGFLLVSSNKVILLQSINNLYNKFNVFHDNTIPLLDKIANSKNTGIKSVISVKTNEELANISLDYLENPSDNKTRLDLVVKYLDDEIINGNVALDDNKIYFFLKEITDDYYYTDFDYQAFIRSLTTSEYDQILEYFKDAITEDVKNDNIKKEKVTIKYNDKDKRVNKITYRIGYKEISKIFDTFTKSLKADKKLYKKVATYLEINTNELDSILDEIGKNIPESDKKIIEYSVYYYGFNKIFRYDFKLISSELTFSYQENTNNCVTTLGVGNVDIVKLVVKENKDTSDYELTIKNPTSEDVYTITGSYDKENLIINYDSNKVAINSTSSEKEDNYVTNTKIVLSDKDDNDITIDINNTYYFDKEIKFNSTNSKNVDDVTEEDINLLLSNFKESKIYELISSNEELSNMLIPEEILIEE